MNHSPDPQPDRVIQFSKTGRVGTIAFNRPKANCYEAGFMTQFNEAIAAADADPDVRVVIVKSAIPKFFCAGADIHVFARNSTAANKEMVRLARLALAKIEASGKVFIASANGHMLGGGLEIAMACDLRFGGDGAWFLGLPEGKLGLLPGNGGSVRLPRIVGATKALELLLTGENISPQEAHRIGLLNRIFPAGDLEREAQTFAGTLARGAPLAMAAIKRSLREGAAMPLCDALELEAALVEPLYDTDDAREGFIAFTEKRPPVYMGR